MYDVHQSLYLFSNGLFYHTITEIYALRGGRNRKSFFVEDHNQRVQVMEHGNGFAEYYVADVFDHGQVTVVEVTRCSQILLYFIGFQDDIVAQNGYQCISPVIVNRGTFKYLK